jgi:cell division protein ZapA
MAKSSKATAATEVDIFGAVYHVRGHQDPEYLQELAEVVDQKMREIAPQVSTVDTAKIAILAALNLTDELFQCQKHQEGERVEIQEKVTALAEQLEQALQE